MSKKYTKEHEWIEQMEGGICRVGITDYAQEQLGDIVVVELPKVGDLVITGGDCAVIESVKAASDIYAPLSGEISKINNGLGANPALVNQDPEKNGWLFDIKISNENELEKLMDKEAYNSFTANL